jgi:hypothetical protein
MDSKYEEYQRNADVCVRLSQTSNEKFRPAWLKLAQAWMGMIPPEQGQTGALSERQRPCVDG